VARALRVPFDVLVVRRLGVPEHEEFAMGALGPGGVRILEREVLRASGVTAETLAAVTDAERMQLERTELRYRGRRPFPDLTGRTVIVVDDGLATAAPMAAAIAVLRKLGPASIVAAAPVGSAAVCEAMRRIADDCRCVVTPEPLYGVASWYEDFAPVTDTEVHALLRGTGPAYALGLPAAPARHTLPHFS
jgi:putative phosphoribosyl transferase